MLRSEFLIGFENIWLIDLKDQSFGKSTKQLICSPNYWIWLVLTLIR